MAIPRTATWLAEVSNGVSQVKREHEAVVEAALAAGLPSECLLEGYRLFSSLVLPL